MTHALDQSLKTPKEQSTFLTLKNVPISMADKYQGCWKFLPVLYKHMTYWGMTQSKFLATVNNCFDVDWNLCP